MNWRLRGSKEGAFNGQEILLRGLLFELRGRKGKEFRFDSFVGNPLVVRLGLAG